MNGALGIHRQTDRQTRVSPPRVLIPPPTLSEWLPPGSSEASGKLALILKENEEIKSDDALRDGLPLQVGGLESQQCWRFTCMAFTYVTTNELCTGNSELTGNFLLKVYWRK